MAPVPGVGFLLANDILTDAAFVLIEPSVNTALVSDFFGGGSHTENVWDPAMYVGALILVGSPGNVEVVEITAVVPGVSFTATYQGPHSAGDPVVGATFPVRQTTDPFFTQPEMLAYLSTAVNDFLTDCPLAYAVGSSTVAPTAQIAALPGDCMCPVRMGVAGYPLRETSQAKLDIYDYRWQQTAASEPYTYFRDKVGIQKFGVWPRANNTTEVEVVYQQRGPNVMGLADGFLIPDPFLTYVLARVLSFAYSKDGEQRNPGLAKFWEMRYALGVKVSNVFLAALMDPNLEMAQ